MDQIQKQPWGALDSGEQIHLYTLRNSQGVETSITNYGGRVVTLKTPDREGNFDDIVLGFESLDGYLGKNPYFGAVVGRYANRIANGRFRLNGATHTLACNNGPNALHGGLEGFDKVAWQAREISNGSAPALELRYHSKDGEEGYPGNLDVTVTYALTADNALNIEYRATTDQDTVLNLTNHSYFDLAGHGSGGILEHRVTINAEKFTPVNADIIPTGELRAVEGTPFDFRKPTPIGARIDEPEEQLLYGHGYDHNFVLNRNAGGPTLAARVLEPSRGRILEVHTTEPGIQFYTGNHLGAGVKGKGDWVCGFRCAFCLETQHFPDSPNHPNFPSTELKAGQLYHSTTIFKFSVD